MSTIVLVHGAWHGAWCWRWVAPLLRAAGHDVFTSTLTGLAERAPELSPETSLDTHIGDIVRMLTFEDLRDVVLVGHSYGGMVVTGVAAASPDRVRQVMYIDCVVPAVGQSVLDCLPPARQQFYRDLAAGDWRMQPRTPEDLGLTDPDLIAWTAARLTPHPWRTMTDPLPAAPAPGAVARSYIYCDPGHPGGAHAGTAAAFQADPAWGFAALRTGHDAMLTVPEALAAALLDLITGDD